MFAQKIKVKNIYMSCYTNNFQKQAMSVPFVNPSIVPILISYSLCGNKLVTIQFTTIELSDCFTFGQFFISCMHTEKKSWLKYCYKYVCRQATNTNDLLQLKEFISILKNKTDH